MPKRAAIIEAEIDRRLAAAVEADSPNRISAREVREWAREYLMHVDEDNEAHPSAADLPHCNLWMHDSRPEDALFVVLVFRTDGVEFFCGVGDSFQVISYNQHDDSPFDELYDHMAERFVITQPPLRIERRAAALWLGRGWKP
jgi:hypothetical protein